MDVRFCLGDKGRGSVFSPPYRTTRTTQQPHDLPHHRGLPRRHLLPHLAALSQGTLPDPEHACLPPHLTMRMRVHAPSHTTQHPLAHRRCRPPSPPPTHTQTPLCSCTPRAATIRHHTNPPTHPPTHSPHQKVWLWYVSVTLLSFMLGFLLLRFLAFLLVWVAGYEFWFLPNLFDESLSFVDSFKPVRTPAPAPEIPLPAARLLPHPHIAPTTSDDQNLYLSPPPTPPHPRSCTRGRRAPAGRASTAAPSSSASRVRLDMFLIGAASFCRRCLLGRRGRRGGTTATTHRPR